MSFLTVKCTVDVAVFLTQHYQKLTGQDTINLIKLNFTWKHFHQVYLPRRHDNRHQTDCGSLILSNDFNSPEACGQTAYANTTLYHHRCQREFLYFGLNQSCGSNDKWLQKINSQRHTGEDTTHEGTYRDINNQIIQCIVFIAITGPIKTHYYLLLVLVLCGKLWMDG